MSDTKRDAVLVVDDDPISRELVEAALVEHYRVLTAADGSAALRVLEVEPIDLAIVDVMMPGLGGHDLCRRIKGRPGGEFLPVILLTSLSGQDDRNEGLVAGADEFLSKPVNPRELQLRVRSLLRLRQQERIIREQAETLEQSNRRLKNQAEELEAAVRERTASLEMQCRLTGQIVDSLPVSLYVVDNDLRVVAWNRQREQGKFGVSRDAALGRTIRDLFPPEHREATEAELRAVAENGATIQGERESPVDGVSRWFRTRKLPMRSERGEVTHVLSIGEDITEQHQAERSMALSEKLAAVGRLAAGVAHEVSTPLATIATCAKALIERLEEGSLGDEAPPEFREYLGLIEGEAFRAKKITGDLLDFSRVSPSEKAKTSLGAIVERTLSILKHHPGLENVEVETRIPADLPDVHVEDDAILQALVVLIVNALDAMPDGGTLRISAREEAGEVRCEVQDTGSGIAPADLPKIFEPFFTTKPPGRGTGLGLAVCHGIVRSHGGRMEVDSSPAEGSRFTLILPIGERPNVEPDPLGGSLELPSCGAATAARGGG